MTLIDEQFAVVQIEEREVHAYGIYRSPTQATLVNIVAVNKEFEPLFVRYSDLSVSQAEEIINQLNKD